MPVKADYRSKQADLMRERRDSARIVVIPQCADRERRAALEADDCAWLRHYFTDLFWYEWQPQQRDMIEAIRRAIQEGDDQAIAASRGEGKTKIAERLLLKYSLSGAIKLSVLFASTGSHAEDSLRSIMGEVEENDLLFAAYPEVCAPVRALENTPNRAHYQKVNGFRHDNGEPYEAAFSRFSWCGQEIIFPRVPGSPAAGAIIATRGLDAAVRGLNKLNRRVDVAIIDDPDTEESARSQEQAAKLMTRIDRAIGGLGGQQRGIGRVVITTLQSRIAVSYQLTDLAAKPSMKGRRFRFMVERPDRMDLWEEYIQLRKLDWSNERNGERTTLAIDFYRENREAMDAGAVVANPYRHYPSQLSAIQFYFDEWARKGEGYVLTELDNDPPEDVGPVESGITPQLIQKQVNGFDRKVIPPGCTVLTHTCDVGKLKGFNWVVRAWQPDGTGHVIDYGVMSVLGAKYGSDEGLDRAICDAVLRRMEEFKAAKYETEDGQTIDDPISTFDARWQTDAVLTGVKKAGIGVYGIIGIGRSAGCVSGSFRDVIQSTHTRRKCGTSGAYEELHVGPYGKLWVIHAHADKWKAFEHDRWMTARDKPGCLFLFGTPSDSPTQLSADERSHGEYANQICAEIEIEENHKRKWITKGKENDYFDASWHGCCAAAIKGVRTLGEGKPSRPPPDQRLSARQLAAGVKR